MNGFWRNAWHILSYPLLGSACVFLLIIPFVIMEKVVEHVMRSSRWSDTIVFSGLLLVSLFTIWFVLFLLGRKTNARQAILLTGRPGTYARESVLLGLFFGLFMTFLLDSLVRNGFYPEPDEETARFLASMPRHIFGICYIVLTGPFLEELIFRGIALRRLLAKMGTLPAILISSVLFALWHLNLYQMPYAFVMGILLGGLYVWTHSLWVPLMMHAAYNATQVACYLLVGNTEEINPVPCAFVMSVALLAAIWTLQSVYRNRTPFDWKKNPSPAPAKPSVSE